jgi:C4-dicarboxylate-specific signal transduction histidine kinase
MTPARLFLCAFAVGCVLSGAVLASDTHQWNAETFVQITPSDRPGVEAEVTFQNRDIHPLQVERFTVELDGLAVGLVLELNTSGADDLLTVTPPPGYYADPPQVVVPENSAVTVLIYVEATS